ncbi:MAG: hypothetical protein IPJ84_14795 [Bdellovibrionales bacterium]|nr:hypothetical protein [Bdellovibrionales bacterium]MBK7892051.1 hypothetical protein [Bdellovibrionales bacterium]
MTCGLAEVAGRLMEEITCEAVGRILDMGSKAMWDLDQYRMAVMMQHLRMPDGLDVSYLAADEVHFRTIAVKNRVGLLRNVGVQNLSQILSRQRKGKSYLTP